MTAYPKTRKRLTITVTDEVVVPPALADPTAMTVTYGRRGYGAPAPTVKHWPGDAEIVHDSLGKFHIEIDCPTAGEWAANVNATAGLVGDSQLAWKISESLIG